MANKYFDNVLIENEIEDQFNSHLDLTQFCTIDNGLETADGMKVSIHRYSATSATEALEIGAANSKDIEATYTTLDYDIKRVQNTARFYDEEAMRDPMIPYTLTNHSGVDMFNYEMASIYGEFKNATKVLPVTKFDFAAFVDAASMIDGEDIEPNGVFAFVNPKDLASVKKALGDLLKPNPELIGRGYIGTVGGVNLYVKKDATEGVITVATKSAVTLFNKVGTVVEDDRDITTKQNVIVCSKYFVPALTDERYAVKMAIGTAAKATSWDASATYYVVNGAGYLKVAEPVESDLDNYYTIA